MKTITIYTSATCPQCRMMKDYMNGKGLSYIEKDVMEPENRQFLMDNGFRGIPVVSVEGGRPFMGFNSAELEKQLAE